jgi:hypothetical protein
MLAFRMVGGIAATSVVMPHFGSSLVRGLISSTMPFSSTQKKKFTAVMSEDQGAQSPSLAIPMPPPSSLVHFQGPIKGVKYYLILLKITECQFISFS